MFYAVFSQSKGNVYFTNYSFLESLKCLTTCLKYAPGLLYNGQIIPCTIISLTRP